MEWPQRRLATVPLAVLLEMGSSRPGTTCDTWRWMAGVEDYGRATGAIHTEFQTRPILFL